MNETDRRILESFKTRLAARGHACRLTLFGSRARGDASPESDLDVLVVAPQLSDTVQRSISECAWETSLEHAVVLVPIVVSAREWEEGPSRSSLLALAVAREGIPL